MIADEIKSLIEESLESLNLEIGCFVVEHPADLRRGDYSTNAGIKTGKAKEILAHLETKFPSGVERVELAGPGFINFYLSKEFFKESLKEIIKEGNEFGRNQNLKGEKIMIEHTQLNPFKLFHIGHLMPNVIGSTIARILDWNGAEVRQANYQGDKGMHVAEAVWAIMHGEKNDPYALGNKAYNENPEAKKKIEEINKTIYEESDVKINEAYQFGKKESLEKFEQIYKKLGTKFDYSLFESEIADKGKKIVEENITKVFERGEGGAIVFKGEKYDPSLHTRVFINSQGIPTYEAKDLGNAKNKYEHYKYTKSIVITANEQQDYFKVVIEAMKQVLPDLGSKTFHITHGILKLPTGKMSSRTGNIISAEELINQVKKKVKGDEQVAIGAIKYMILRQAVGSDIVFDINKSVSTEGDSGVYLQYAYARSVSLLAKADKVSTSQVDTRGVLKEGEEKVYEIERFLYRFPEVVERAGKEYAPHFITTYLTELASSFNNFYAHEQVISDDPESPYRLAIVKAFNIVMKNGLDILGIPTPERM